VLVEPHLGNLSWARGTIPHPEGTLFLSYEKRDGVWNVSISLPGKLTGRLIWMGKTNALKSGRNVFQMH
jgi:alpha-L-rhamnosidase